MPSLTTQHHGPKAELLTAQYKITADRRFASERARGGDGYDVMDAVGTPPAWVAASLWGHDGWDLGHWPYVVIYCRSHAGRHELAYYVEGDVDTYSYATTADLYAAIDHLAFFHWQSRGQKWVAGVESSDDMQPHMCGPFQWSRVGSDS